MLCGAILLGPSAWAGPGFVLDPEAFRHHIAFFNGMAAEEVVNYVPNERAWE